MSDIRAVLLDKDGTLVDFEATWTSVARQMALMAADGDPVRAEFLLEEAGLDPATNRFRPDSIFAAGSNAEVVELWHPQLDRAELAVAIKRFDAFSSSAGAESAVMVAGVPEALARLHALDLILGVATNDSTAGAERTLRALGVSALFAAAFGYDAVARPKPAPDMMHAFADLTGLKPSQIAMVGDSRHDLETGRAAGAGLVVGVLSGTGTREALEPLADLLIGSVAELPDLLRPRTAN